MENRRLITFTPWILLASLWSAMILALLFIGLGEQKERVLNHAEILADASFNKDILYRRWSTEHGGTYVPVTEATPPNPYLSHLPDRDITTSAGKHLTLINPAYMTRQVNEMDQSKASLHGHITSLNPLRPENLADSWETEGLKKLVSGNVTKVVESFESDGEPHLRAIYPLITEPNCIKCHAGYRVGDIRGGISVIVPLAPYLPHYQESQYTQISLFSLIWLVGLTLLTWSVNIIRKQFIKLETSRARAATAEDRYRDLFHDAEYGIAIVDLETGTINECNQKLATLIGKTQKELIGAEQSILPDIEDLQTSLTGKEIKIQNDAGETAYIEAKKRIITLSGKRSAELFFYDRTIQKKSEQQVLATARRIKDIFQAAQNIAFVIASSTENAAILEFSPGAEQIFGYHKDEVLGKPVTILHPPETDIPDMQNRMGSSEIAFSGRIELVRKSGEVFPALFTLYPLNDEHGELYGGLGVSIDISELKGLEERLIQTQKMEAIGTLAGGIAHDFNNILSIIFGYTQMAIRQIDDEEKTLKHLQTIERAANRAKELVRQILTFSRKSPEKKQVLSLQPVVKEALKMLRATLPNNIEIKKDIAEQGGHVFADPTQIHQILMNICTNAYHAMRQSGGTMKVVVRDIVVDQNLADKHPNLSVGGYVLLQISDTGPGIDEDVLPRIFDPFFTTKITHGGTGMGLSVVHGIVQTHEGEITVDTDPEMGTCFSIYLPKVEEQEATLAEEVEVVAKGVETILMVDDEPMLAALGHDLLSALGYNVKVSTDSRKALEIFKTAPQEYDLVVTDQAMPFMTGTELTKELLEIRPDLPVIICTGFSELINQENFKEFGATRLLNKPLQKNQLAKSIQEIFDTP